jgi:hypothetical protein
MDKTIADCSGATVARQQAVSIGQPFAKLGQRSVQIGFGVAIVMNMHFDFAVSLATQLGQHIEDFRVILFNWEKECVPRRQAVAVMEPRKSFGVFIDPARDPGQRVLARHAAKERFVMVGDAKEEVYRFVASRQASIWPASQVRRQPAVQVALLHLPDPQGDQPNDGQEYN